MRGQVGLAVDVHSGSHVRLGFDHVPYYVAALEVCLKAVPVPHVSRSGPVTVLSNGLLAGSELSVASDLTVAANDEGAGLHLAGMSGIGLPFDGLGCSPVILVGQAERPSILVLERRRGVVHTSLVTLDALGVQREVCAEGTGALLRYLCPSFADRLASAAILGTGPASYYTPFGALLGAIFDRQRWSVCAASNRGGLGSRLLQCHGLAAVIVGSDRSIDQLIDRTRGGWLAELLDAERVAERDVLAQCLHREWPRLLCFNGQSIYWKPELRDDLLRRNTRDRLLRELNARPTDGGPAALVRQPESVLWMGPQLGVFEGRQLGDLLEQVVELGFDTSTLGSLIGWLLERLQRGMLVPQQVGLSRRPSWDVPRDLEQASSDNAELVATLMQRLLYDKWAVPLRGGLRSAAAAAGVGEADLLLWQALGRGGEAALQPFWRLSSVAPLPWPVAGLSPGAAGFTPPRPFGRRCAEHWVMHLAMVNGGIARSSGERLLVLYPELMTALYGVPDGWLVRHRRLAETLYRRIRPRPWHRGRVLDWVLRDLQLKVADGASGDLEQWLHRLSCDPPSAVRALWCEIDSGIGEGLAS